MSDDNSLHAEVLVVGAGPVGLALAMELGLRSIDTILIEKQPKRGIQPRAKTLNVRSLEHFRRWGIADTVRAASPLPAKLKTDIVFITSLYGKHVTTIPNAFFGGNQEDQRFSEPGQWMPQYVVEAQLREKIRQLPSVRMIEGVEFVGLEETENRVAASVTSEGKETTIFAEYVVGADGARSKVREAMGARMEGQYAYAANYNLVLRIPGLRTDPPAHEGIMFWTLNPDGPAVFGPMDANDIWYMVTQLPPGKTEMSDAEIKEVVLAAIGRDLDFEIVSVDPWLAHQLIATRYSKGRTFLAGDACHLHPPAGGFGMNMGIADGVDLGWKIAARLRGWGGEHLLESYEAERRPVHEETVREAVENYSTMSNQLLRPGLETDGPEGDDLRARAAEEIRTMKTKEFRTLGLVLGYSYGQSPIVIGNEDAPVFREVENYIPDDSAGALAPHLWLGQGNSLYDLFGPELTLLVPRSAPDQVAMFYEAADAAGVPLTVVDIQDSRIEALYGTRLALIRPDQHIAWRGQVRALSEASQVLAIIVGVERKGHEQPVIQAV